MNKKRIIAIGNFDGVHLGHRRLLEEAVSMAKQLRLKEKTTTPIITQCITFERLFLIPEGKILTPIDEKISLLRGTALIDEIIVLPDDKNIWQMSAENFVKKIILPQNPLGIVAGKDFRFGKGGKGDIFFLQKTLHQNISSRKISVKMLDDVKYNNQRISSSIIREKIYKGEVDTAQKMLGRFYSVNGKTIKGFGIAGKLGFPTINLLINPDKLLPRQGIFAAFASPHFANKKTDMIFPSAVYIGNSPTLNKKLTKRFEFHIISVKNEKKIKSVLENTNFWTVYFVKKIRDEKKFSSDAHLKKAIKKDIMKIQSIFSPQQ